MLSIFRPTVEVRDHVYGKINRQKHEFPLFPGKIEHAHRVCIYYALSPPPQKGPGEEAKCKHTKKEKLDYIHIYPTYYTSCIGQGGNLFS